MIVKEREEITTSIKELEKHKIFENNDQQHSIKRMTISNFTEAIFYVVSADVECKCIHYLRADCAK